MHRNTHVCLVNDSMNVFMTIETIYYIYLIRIGGIDLLLCAYTGVTRQ